MDFLYKVVSTVNTYLTDYILIFLLVGTGIFFTIRTRFVQVRCFGEGMKSVFGKISLHGKGHGGSLTSFQALATAVAAQVGTGNIVGACGAILIGGPGAIFWMWIIAFFGMATIYAEAVLALGFMGTMVQSNSIGSTFQTAFGVPSWIVGIVVAVLAGIIFIGGAKRIALVAEKLVPIMAVLFLLGGIVVLCSRIKFIPETFAMIFKEAFVPKAAIGGALGVAIKKAISQGAKRGLFSNEAGMGSTPHAHALAHVKRPHDQGVVAMIGVFIDTFVVLTMTALVVITTLYTGDGILASEVAPAGIDKTNMAQTAFSGVFGQGLGQAFVAICLFFFAFSTILSWNLFGRINMNYLFGKRSNLIYSILAMGFIVLGSFLSNDLVWELTDFFNYLMVLPNVIALIALSSYVAKESRKPGKSLKEKAEQAEKVTVAAE